jgi:N4-gp56 family major capsid protein
MARTNFAALTNEEKTIWSMEFWKQVRNKSFVSKFVGSGESAMIQRITDLRKDEKGARCVMTLVADLEGDGVAGDNTLDGREESMVQDEQVIQLDQLRHANINKGRMSDQRSIVNFREQSRDKLAYWMGDRIDQMAFLALSGVGFGYRTDGPARVGSQLSDLEFAGDVTTPSTNRHWRWDAVTGLTAGSTTDMVIADVPTYEMLVEMRAKAEVSKLKPISGQGGDELYHVFLHPYAFAKLRMDDDYLANVRSAGTRGGSNELFSGTGGTVTQDGLVLHSYKHVFNTEGLTSGTDKWGSAKKVDGCRILMCGSQALGLGDIGNAAYVEDGKDYGNQQGISYGKILGMKKPKFINNATRTVEDFGVMVVDVATGGADS